MQVNLKLHCETRDRTDHEADAEGRLTKFDLTRNVYRDTPEVLTLLYMGEAL